MVLIFYINTYKNRCFLKQTRTKIFLFTKMGVLFGSLKRTFERTSKVLLYPTNFGESKIPQLAT